MAPSKGKKQKSTSQTSASSATSNQPPKTPQTIGEKLETEYLASRPYQVLFEKKGWSGLSADEKTGYANFRLLEFGTYEKWTPQEQKEFLKYCEKLKIPQPLPKPFSSESEEGASREQKRVEALSLDQYKEWKRQQGELSLLKRESGQFRDRTRRERALAKVGKKQPGTTNVKKSEDIERFEALFAAAQEKLGVSFRPLTGPVTEEEIQEERTRRIRIRELEGKKMPGIYEGDPIWDDVVPIPQDDGEKPLAAIAYTDEYAEAISYLRAIMAAREYSPRALSLTAHIIDLNPAHYTVWLFRSSILFALNSSLLGELQWVNSVALANEKNYQIWHHRQLLLDHIYPTLASDRARVLSFARSEAAFMAQMFDLDSKNYHVWSYRQYFVRKLSLFPTQVADREAERALGPFSELLTVEHMLDRDVRNNSAWAHRFFVVFSDPGHATANSRDCDRDEKIPPAIIDREIEFSKAHIRRAPQNQSGWNYVRGVLRKAGRELASLEEFVGEFAVIDHSAAAVVVDSAGGDDESQHSVKSSHALEFLADIWTARGEGKDGIDKADQAFVLLAERYDRVRKNYWEYRRELLKSK